MQETEISQKIEETSYCSPTKHTFTMKASYDLPLRSRSKGVGSFVAASLGKASSAPVKRRSLSSFREKAFFPLLITVFVMIIRQQLYEMTTTTTPLAVESSMHLEGLLHEIGTVGSRMLSRHSPSTTRNIQ
jgi:hypothetical protein